MSPGGARRPGLGGLSAVSPRRRPPGGAPRREARGQVRPTSARVRTGLYDSLGEWVVGRRVLDLFAGSGALGVEALRRGACRVVFVEHDAAQARALRERLERLGMRRCAVVLRGDALEAAGRLGRAGEAYDLVLLDPPYGTGLVTRSLAAIADSGVLAPGGLVVAEGHWRDRPVLPAGHEVAREARYGETALWFIRKSDRPRTAREKGAGMRTAVYPGSFDPVHHGHMEVIRRAVRLFDRVIVAVAENIDKGLGSFKFEDRVAMLREALAVMPTVEVASYNGLTVDFARSRGATCLIKGLRAVGDFDYELKQSAMNRLLAPDLDTLLFIADPEFAFISSSLIREVSVLGGDASGLVPPAVAERLQARWPRRE